MVFLDTLYCGSKSSLATMRVATRLMIGLLIPKDHPGENLTKRFPFSIIRADLIAVFYSIEAVLVTSDCTTAKLFHERSATPFVPFYFVRKLPAPPCPALTPP